jgi:hypothetical protein
MDRAGRTRLLMQQMIAAAVAGASLTVVAVAQMSDGAIDAESYWHQPLAAQGEPPRNWTAVEQSLAPEDCGQCHADQFAQWQTSRHAHSFSPGLVGQILTYDAADTADCLQCHAPLAEQRTAFEAARNLGVRAVTEKDGLAAAGNSCGGCHVRAYHRYGPPQRGTGAIGASALPAPHDGAQQTRLFEASEFCSVCHQFPASLAVNGKPIENTYAEWQASPQAAQGATCQACHMPDRQHLWRGIHDPAMVASGLTPRVTVNTERVRFEITNTGVGHAFPTYVTPRAVMHAVALDAAGAPRPETARSYEIVRKVHYENDRWIELSDSRLLPGQSAAIELLWNGSDRVRTWLEIVPDDFYERDVFPGLLDSMPPDSDARRLIFEASAEAANSHFRLYESELQRP